MHRKKRLNIQQNETRSLEEAFHISAEFVKYKIHEYLLFRKKLKCLFIKRINVISTFIMFGSTVLTCHIFAILYGQSVFSNVTETFVYSTILAALLQFPQYLYTRVHFILHIFGVKSVTNDLISKAMFSISYSTICGTWLGAFVIPLDWNRPWQKWPIPCTLGALLGHTVGQLYAFIIYYKSFY